MTDEKKLRILANWFDLQDEDKKAISFDTNNEVQKDLRRIADRLESLQAELNELKTHPQVLTLMARIEALEAENERLKDIEKSLREVIANREEELDGAVQLIREKQSKLDRVIEFVKPYAKADGGYVWAAKILDLLK